MSSHLGNFTGTNLRRLSWQQKARAQKASIGLIIAIIVMGAVFASVFAGLAKADEYYASEEV